MTDHRAEALRLLAEADSHPEPGPVVAAAQVHAMLHASSLHERMLAVSDELIEASRPAAPAARQATGQADTTPTPWTADGRQRPTPEEMADARIPTCYVQFMGGAHCHTAPVVGQPAAAPDTDARQPRTTWRTESIETDGFETTWTVEDETR
ncbi:hypothetical protein [Streptomyces cinereoruber]|uniref:hypothetical protein n=1 Tax=Streptomyces cinereoruber TaxID=67260 RepID=UPI003C2AB88C